MPDHNYIIRIRDAEFDIVGPFGSQDKLAAWGKASQAASEDDPRWQSVYLVDPEGTPRLLTPGEASRLASIDQNGVRSESHDPRAHDG